MRRSGETCGGIAGRCAAGTFCELASFSDGGLCQPVAAVGEACAENRGCASGWCDGGLCRDGGCAI